MKVIFFAGAIDACAGKERLAFEAPAARRTFGDAVVLSFRIKRSAGETSATAAREAAKAAAKERQSRRRVPLASDQLAELARMKVELLQSPKGVPFLCDTSDRRVSET